MAAAFTWTTTLLATEATSDNAYLVTVHLEGDFPGGMVDLKQKFQLREGLIAVLDIHP